MEIKVYTGHEEQILKIGVRTTKPQQIKLVVSDAKKANTILTNRFATVNNADHFFYVRMPLAPMITLIQVYNGASQNKNNSDGFTLIDSKGRPTDHVEKMMLEKKMDLTDMDNPVVRKFVEFAQRFAYNAGVLQPGVYKSSSGDYAINYEPTIYDENSGRESTTPARIGESSGIIDVSRKMFVPYTVPMRMVILLHEFAHKWLNARPESEQEADLQGLLIYLGLGYPRSDAYQAFREIFLSTPSALNQARYKTVNRFITDFENNKFLFKD